MRLSDFYYQLPKELIAQFPLEVRDKSRLLVLERKSGKIYHKRFCDIPEYLRPNDCLILNNTKVFPARIFGRRASGGKVEILLLEKMEQKIGQKIGTTTFRCLVKPGRVKLDETINFNGAKFRGRLIRKALAQNLIRFESNGDILSLIRRLGVMPLPAYIKRQAQQSDRETYQTVYAEREGAVASPTAGLHFTKNLLGHIKEKGVNIGYLTLHVGWGTFMPIRSEDLASHKMEEEEFDLSLSACNLVNKTRQKEGRVFSVGSTSTRVLETVIRTKETKHRLLPMRGKTDLFIYPDFKFKIVDCLLTNFHLPKSTLFLLVCAFAGKDLIFKAYQEAIREKYRFYSYGDAMLIL